MVEIYIKLRLRKKSEEEIVESIEDVKGIVKEKMEVKKGKMEKGKNDNFEIEMWRENKKRMEERMKKMK